MPNDTFASFAKRLDTFMDGLKNPELERVMRTIGKAAEKDVERAVDADIGGNTFSGWPKATITTEQHHPAQGQVEVRPRGKARGPVRVAESGRNQGNASGFAGPGLNVRTGNRSRGGVRQTGVRRSKRWNGVTAPKYTWSDAEKVIERETPKRLETEIRRAIRKAFD